MNHFYTWIYFIKYLIILNPKIDEANNVPCFSSHWGFKGRWPLVPLSCTKGGLIIIKKAHFLAHVRSITYLLPVNYFHFSGRFLCYLSTAIYFIESMSWNSYWQARLMHKKKKKNHSGLFGVNSLSILIQDILYVIHHLNS